MRLLGPGLLFTDSLGTFLTTDPVYFLIISLFRSAVCL